MTTIASALMRVKDESSKLLNPSEVFQACVDEGHQWRDRLLDPLATLRLLILQVLHGNVSCRRTIRIANLNASAMAYCKARSRLPLGVLQRLCHRLTQRVGDTTSSLNLWHGHRMFMVDGTGVSMPDTPELQHQFGQPTAMKPGCGFPVMHLLVMFDAATGLITDLISGRWDTHDHRDVSKLHPKLKATDLILADRGFCSYGHLALVLQGHLHAVFRLHQRVKADFRQGRKHQKQLPKTRRRGRPTSRHIQKLGSLDQWAEYTKPKKRPTWMTATQFDRLPDSIVVRELRYTTQRSGFRTQQVTLVTTLLDPQVYPKQALADLYKTRWQVETNLLALKQTMGMDVLRGQSVRVVMIELWVFVLVYNLVRIVMLRAAREQNVSLDCVSFIDAMDIIRYGLPKQTLPHVAINPDRPGRAQPRVIKRRKDRYRYMTRPRPVLKKELGITKVTA
jgi:hypothetical protein